MKCGTKDHLIEVQQVRLDELRAELDDICKHAGETLPTVSEPSASPPSADPRDDTIQQNGTRMADLKRAAFAVRGRHADLFPPSPVTLCVKRGSADIAQAMAPFRRLLDNNDLTSIQRKNAFARLPAQPFEDEGEVADVRVDSGQCRLKLRLGISRREVDFAWPGGEMQASAVKKGAWCSARGVVRGCNTSDITVTAVSLMGLGTVAVSPPTRTRTASVASTARPTPTGTTVPVDRGQSDSELASIMKQADERANQQLRLGDASAEKDGETAFRERQAALQFLALRDQAEYVLACRLLKKGDHREARRHFVKIVESQLDSPLGQAARQKMDATP